ncbi:transcription factor HES-4-like [Eriocheir sinensis]|uniref:transcription factor HES-4-like n=1 Tax=Eriocheir sinensis TaxID=95602 RepID=UPI0021C892E4|nr:transcription factor HES-4-like [Eriocheir sinensis]
MADAAHAVTLAAPLVMCSSTHSIMTDSQKARRSNKPLMERRRRERINTCLNELKNLVLTAQRKDPTRYSKLEKADILEMTVRHVQALHRHEAATGRSLNTDATAKYRAGFTQCAAEVSKFLAGVGGLPSDLHTRILAHLSSYNLPESQAVKPEATAVKALTPAGSPQQKEAQQGSVAGVPLIQARLTSGQLALVLPSWTALPTGSSLPTVAASPDTAGAPSSPESARGSPPASTEAHEGHSEPDTCPADDDTPTSSRLQPSPGQASPPLGTPGPQTAPQVAPLDLATPHRRGSAYLNTVRHRPPPDTRGEASSPSVVEREAATLPRPGVTAAPLHGASKCPATSSKSPAPSHEHRVTRHAPYPAHCPRPPSHHQKNPHWRPW